MYDQVLKQSLLPAQTDDEAGESTIGGSCRIQKIKLRDGYLEGRYTGLVG